MKKTITKVLSLVFAMIMVMSISAMAAETGKTVKLTGGKAGHTYTLYQVFTGTVDGTELTDIQWGTGVTDAFKETKSTAAAYAKEVAEKDDARSTAQDLISANALVDGTEKILSSDGDVVFDNLPEGYYIVVDANNNEDVTKGDYSSAVIVQVVNDVNMKLKGSGATSEKKVDDKNDSNTTEDATAWQDSADYDIGDDVPFQLKATTADNVAAYKKYHVTFQDNYSDGLDAPESFTVSVLGKSITLPSNAEGTSGTAISDEGTGITAEVVAPAAGQDFAIKVTFEPTGDGATYLNAECNSKDILVNYTQVLNDKAKIGVVGNPNKSYILYSNNPESTDDHEEGKTPEDTVIVFTYQLDVDKIDETGAALKGAGFTLYKKNAASTADDKYEAVGGEVKGTDLTNFAWIGIDDGEYKIVETTVPDGYNKADDIVFTVTANHVVESPNPQLTELTVSENSGLKTILEGGQITLTKKDATKDIVSGEIYGEVINRSGSTLPSTGGMGTTIFYVIGGILVLAAVIVLISKRRVQQ